MRLSILIFLSLFSLLYAETIEIRYISEISQHIQPKDLVIFDIDNTIMEPAQGLGSDQWFRHRVERYEKTGLSHIDAMEKVLPEWMAMQCLSPVKLVEPHTAALIKDLQDKGHTVIGLTTRELGFSTQSIRQLRSLNVHLEKTALTKEEIFFQNTHACLFRQGILFTANTHKGYALKRLLKELKYTPKAVVFINDKASHLKDVEEYCREGKIPFKGLRYGFLDEKVKNFQGDFADQQFERMQNLLLEKQTDKLIASESVQ